MLPEEASIGDILGRLRDVMHEEPANQRMRSRLSSNMVREYDTHPHDPHVHDHNEEHRSVRAESYHHGNQPQHSHNKKSNK